jgi:hypothetical protein
LILIALVNWIEAKTLHRHGLCTAVLARCERLPKFNGNKLCSLSFLLWAIVQRGILILSIGGRERDTAGELNNWPWQPKSWRGATLLEPW